MTFNFSLFSKNDTKIFIATASIFYWTVTRYDLNGLLWLAFQDEKSCNKVYFLANSDWSSLFVCLFAISFSNKVIKWTKFGCTEYIRLISSVHKNTLLSINHYIQLSYGWRTYNKIMNETDPQNLQKSAVAYIYSNYKFKNKKTKKKNCSEHELHIDLTYRDHLQIRNDLKRKN